MPFTERSFLVLYTDGLVERRDEDIDTGLARLAASLTRHRGAGAEVLAEALPADLLPSAGADDDTALVVGPLQEPVRPRSAPRTTGPGTRCVTGLRAYSGASIVTGLPRS